MATRCFQKTGILIRDGYIPIEYRARPIRPLPLSIKVRYLLSIRKTVIFIRDGYISASVQEPHQVRWKAAKRQRMGQSNGQNGMGFAIFVSVYSLVYSSRMRIPIF